MTRKRRTQRLRRVDETLRQIISDSILAHGERQLESVVVTGVEASSDTAFADVYVQVPGNDVKRQKTLAALTPVLRFRVDDTLEQGLRIERLLQEHKPVGDGE
jgi:ribosome-binding factor A